jgi:hypothetical protein
MVEWWESLTFLNQVFYGVAAFFSVFFVWQLIAALIGLGGEGGDLEEAGDVDAGGGADVAESAASFKLLSIRSIITLFTLFTWGTALYLDSDVAISKAMGYSAIWGVAGMFAVALIFFAMRKLVETGTSDLSTCIGTPGTVYLDIPKDGPGEVRVTVSGVVSHVKARSTGGKGIKAGTPIRVVRRLNQTTVEVEPIEREKQ